MLKIQSLENALDKVSLKTIKNVFNKFKCKKDEDVEKFLNTYSIDYQNKGVARTFIIIDDKNPTDIAAFFSIGVNVYKFNKKLKIDDAYQGINLYEGDYRPIYKLFMIGKNDNYKSIINMKEIYKKHILNYFKYAYKFIGINFIYLDCVPKLRHYYEQLGYEF